MPEAPDLSSTEARNIRSVTRAKGGLLKTFEDYERGGDPAWGAGERLIGRSLVAPDQLAPP